MKKAGPDLLQRSWITASKILLALVLLALLSLKIKWPEVLSRLNLISWMDIGVCVALNFSALFVATLKWHRLLPEVALSRLFKFNLISQFYAVVLSGQVSGEIAKAYWLGKSQKDMERVSVSVLLDKVSGFLALLIMALIGICFSKRGYSLPVILNLAGLIALILLSLVVARSDFYRWFSARFEKPKHMLPLLDKGLRFFEKCALLWRAYSVDLRLMAVLLMISVVYQCMGGLIVYRLSTSLGLGIGFWDSFWILAVLAGALSLPVTLAGIGVREATLAGLLSVFAVSPEHAVAFSLSLFLTQVLSALWGGVVHVYDSFR